MKGKTALITGAARRIGKALTLRCAREGINIILHYHSSRREAEEVAAQVEACGVKSFLFHADLSVPMQAEKLFKKAKKEAGNVDILVNNASLFMKDTLATFTYEALSTNIAVNALAPLILSRKLAAQDRGGKIINLLDARITDYDDRHTAYHLSKRMLCDLTRMMAIEFAPHITVNGIAPGLILPPPGEDTVFLKKMAHTNPLNMHGTLDDITDAALFLINSSFITGQIIFVDGGRHLKGCMYGT
jgi:pteridine reductase